MRIAVIADTHDRLPPFVVDAVAAADEIWHLGDVCRRDVLEPLIAQGRPLVVVRGNCDAGNEWPQFCRLRRGPWEFQLVHVPPPRPLDGVQVVLHGHTHVPRDEDVRGVRYLNPGCITRPNRGAPPSYAWLTVADDGSLAWSVVVIA